MILIDVGQLDCRELLVDFYKSYTGPPIQRKPQQIIVYRFGLMFLLWEIAFLLSSYLEINSVMEPWGLGGSLINVFGNCIFVQGWGQWITVWSVSGLGGDCFPQGDCSKVVFYFNLEIAPSDECLLVIFELSCQIFLDVLSLVVNLLWFCRHVRHWRVATTQRSPS